MKWRSAASPNGTSASRTSGESDYQVICAESAEDPLRLLGSLRDDRRLVSIVLAGQWMSAMPGTELLARVREFHRTAKRLLLIDREYGPPPEPILQAIALGHIDAYVARPATVPDQGFHRAVTELLEKWARSHLPGFEHARIEQISGLTGQGPLRHQSHLRFSPLRDRVARRRRGVAGRRAPAPRRQRRCLRISTA